MLNPGRRIIFWLTFHAWMKIILTAMIILLSLFVFAYQLPATMTWNYWTTPLTGRVIVLDPGHGGQDGGAVSKSGLVEKDVTLAIALDVRDYLQEAGAVVVMTRESDKDLAKEGTRGLSKRKTEDLLARGQLVQESQANMLISIHLNSIPSSQWHGAQTFYYPSLKENQILATMIQDELKRNLQNTDRLANTVSTVYLMKTSEIPSALVEVGFLSNPAEAANLANKQYQQKIAAAIYQGILRFYSGEKIGIP